jgi:outer membrane receptor protein involved in Fe transport
LQVGEDNPRGCCARRAHRALAWIIAAGLIAPLLVHADGPTVSGKELARLGFFQDFDELDLATLLETATPTVSVANRLEGAVPHAQGAVVVVTDEQMRSWGTRTLEDVLRLIPGFDVVRDTLGRPRIVVRGGGLDGSFGASGGVLLLLNGGRLNEAITGSATSVNLDLPVEHVHRIEIWRGAGSALYGSGAERAVINVVTHTVRDFQGIGLAAEAGSNGLQNYSLRLANTFKGLTFSSLLQWSDTDGAAQPVPVDRQTVLDRALLPLGIAPVSLAPGETSEHRRLFQSTYVVGYGDFSLQWHSLREETGGSVGFADTLGSGNRVDGRQSGLVMGYNHAFPAARVQARVSSGSSRSDLTLNTAPPGFTLLLPEDQQAHFPSGIYVQSLLGVRRNDAEVLAERHTGGHTFLGGLELARESTVDLDVRSNLNYMTGQILDDVQSLSGPVSARQRDSFGAYVQDSWNHSRLGVTAGLRFDHVSDAGDHVSPRVSVAVDASDDLSLNALYARGFRAPSFEELYFNFPGQQGNAALKAPVSDTFESGVTYRLHNLTVSAQGFWSKEVDPVSFASVFDPRVTQPWINGPDLIARGVEFELRRGFGLEDSVFANAVLQRAEHDLASGRVRAAGVPSQLVNAGVTFALGPRLIVSPTLSWRGSRPRAAGDLRAPLDAYALANVAVRLRRVYKTLEFVGVIHNLFDERYADPAPLGGLPDDYPRAGRSARLQAAFRF